jgi:nucleotide-binding universal stress UspA family protein
VGVTAALRPVVVGIDGSSTARAAATAAARQARQALRPLRLVRAVPGTASRGPSGSDLVRQAADELDRLRTELRAEAPALPIGTAVRGGLPDLVLLDEARTAALLVLGTGPTGAATGLDPDVASVIAKASCPVLVHRAGAVSRTGVVVGADAVTLSR